MTQHSDSSGDRTAVAEAYFKRMDAGQDFLPLFAEDAYVYFPKHAPARGIDEVRALFADVFELFGSIVHEVPYFNYITEGDRVVAEGVTHGELADGTPWRATEGLGGRFCNVFEIRNGKIHRLHIYLDPDYGDQDVDRYPWLKRSS
ncbi:nuclear transport factor 2 family protein [Saccharopolyspora endophytica]|uniref:Nuclear transport factor 2 family protein n=1 Tax=Saccharopolyspora endophytica TaxID=543886 RepID=A0ABS5DH45_9PSEU|nr:nuclear transport factor 2 family protein [Saccharopolyspora endophytica]MBQ0925462.1 nuclear transport factor 2 family protein [Saccharopolyspora endophytica]